MFSILIEPEDFYVFECHFMLPCTCLGQVEVANENLFSTD